MKALSIKQPFLAEIMEGVKTIEMRTRPTAFRGDLLLCASKNPAKEYFDPGDENLPLGMALCIVHLDDCRPLLPADLDAAYACDFEPGWFAWCLSNVRPIKPFAVSGKSGIFDVKLPKSRA